MRRALSVILLVASCLSLWAQTLTNYQYWIDTDQLQLTTGPMPSNSGSAEVNWSIPTGGLREGLHTLFYRFQDDESVWSAPYAWQFFVVRAPKHKTKLLQRSPNTHPLLRSPKTLPSVSASRRASQAHTTRLPQKRARQQAVSARPSRRKVPP